LVGEGDKQYLKLKESYVLGNEELGRYIVRPIYKELCGRLGRGDVRKWVVTGTPGIGKPIFSAYSM
jgi:hypothetical protein